MNNTNHLNNTSVLRITRLFTVLCLSSVLINCGEQNQFIEPPPATVTVAKPLQKEITEYLNFTGTTQAVGFVEVRARVSGVLQSMHFEPGTHVDKDELLFIIDPKPYQADLHAAEADLASAKAEYHRTQVELERADQLIKRKFISKTDHLRRLTERNVAKATIGRMQAKVENAQIKLGYTHVTAPIAGRVSRKMVDVGNLVGEGEATLLTTVTQNKPMYAYFHLNERDLLQIMQVHRDKIQEKGYDYGTHPDSDLEIPVYLGLATEDDYPHQGILDFAESRVDTETGTIELRATFPNQQNPPKLIAGLFTRIRLPIGQNPDALLVSERALSADQSGDYLLVVNKENIVEKRNVIRGQVLDGLMAIEKGIQADDRVIINGLQRARPGVKVNPEEVEMGAEQMSKKPPDINQATLEIQQKNTGNGHPETADKG